MKRFLSSGPWLSPAGGGRTHLLRCARDQRRRFTTGARVGTASPSLIGSNTMRVS